MDEDIIKLNLDQQRQEYQADQQVKEIYEKGKSFQKPSKLKYGILFTLAIIIDIFGFLDLTGVGWFLGKLITVPCFLLSLGICFATNTKHKEAQNYVAELEDKLHQIGAKSKFAIKQAAKFIGRNPAALVALGEGIDIILPPILSLLFLSTVWVYIAYRSEARALREASEAADQIAEAQENIAA